MNHFESSSDKVCVLTTCADPVEADLLKIALEASDIDAIVDGNDLHTAMGYVGPALGDVRILVREGDLEQAREVQASWEKDRFQLRNQPPWFCGKCDVDVEGHFLACWSCSESREAVEAPFPATASQIEDAFHGAPATAELSDPHNPWASPSTGLLGESTAVRDDDEHQRFITRTYAIPAMAMACLSFWLPVVSVVCVMLGLHMAINGPRPTRKRKPLSRRNLMLLAAALSISLMGTLFWMFNPFSF